LAGKAIHVGCQHISNRFIEVIVWAAFGAFFCGRYVYKYIFLSARLPYPEGGGSQGCSGSCCTCLSWGSDRCPGEAALFCSACRARDPFAAGKQLSWCRVKMQNRKYEDKLVRGG